MTDDILARIPDVLQWIRRQPPSDWMTRAAGALEAAQELEAEGDEWREIADRNRGYWRNRAEKAEAEAARYRAYVQKWADIRCLNGGDCGECASCEARHALAAAERKPKRPPKVDRPRGPSVGEQLRAGREPSYLSARGVIPDPPEKAEDVIRRTRDGAEREPSEEAAEPHEVGQPLYRDGWQ